MDILDSGSLKIQYNRRGPQTHLFAFGGPNRYYDYYSGRWLTHDPLGITPNAQKPNEFNANDQYKDSLNMYEYVQSNPTLNLDHSGFRLRKSGEYVANRGVVSIYLSNAYAHRFTMDVQIFFYPNEKARSCCDKISFGQIVKTYKHTTLGGKKTGWHLDRSFPYKLSTPWTKDPPKWRAEAEDEPGYIGIFRLHALSQDFETCAICLKGCDIGANYGCVTWGHTLYRTTNPTTEAIDYYVLRALHTGSASISTHGWLGGSNLNISAFEHPPKSPSRKFHKIADPKIP